MEFAYKLKELRLNSHMTQAELAKALFVSRTLVSKWESGDRHPTEENVSRLCELFSVSRESLLGLPRQNEAAGRTARGGLLVGYSLGLVLSMLVLFAVFLCQRAEPWAPIGVRLISLAYAFPVFVALLLFVFDVRRRKERRRAAIFSFFSVIVAWLLSLACYFYIF